MTVLVAEDENKWKAIVRTVVRFVPQKGRSYSCDTEHPVGRDTEFEECAPLADKLPPELGGGGAQPNIKHKPIVFSTKSNSEERT